MARIALSIVVVALAVISVQPALAHFDSSDRYTHRSCPASVSNRTDPVNVVFTMWGTWGRAQSQIEAHAGWTSSVGSTQSFVDHGACSTMHTQRAASDGWAALISLHQVNH